MFKEENEITVLTIAGLITTTLIASIFGAIGVSLIMGIDYLLFDSPEQKVKEAAYVGGFISFCVSWVSLITNVIDMLIDDVYGD